MSTRYKRKTTKNTTAYDAKTKRVKVAKITGYASNTELYAKTLINPMGPSRAKIPDMVCNPTSTFELQDAFDWDPWTNGGPNVLGIKVGAGPSFNGNAIPVISQANNTQGFANPSATGSIRFVNDLTTPATFGPYNRFMQGWDKVRANYSQIRLVSCGVQIEFTGGDTENAGTIQACIVNAIDGLNGTSYGNPGKADSVNMQALGNRPAGIAANFYGISEEMILNGRESYGGPGRFGLYYAYRPTEPVQRLVLPRANTAGNIVPATDSDTIFWDECLIVWPKMSSSETVRYRVTIKAKFEGTVLDSTYPKPPINASPMDIYGQQAAVEAALITPRLGSLSEGPDFTWKQLENTGMAKFAQVVSMSQGR